MEADANRQDGEKDDPQENKTGLSINLPDIFRYGKDKNQTIDRR